VILKDRGITMTDYNKNLVHLNRQLEQLILILYKKPSKVKKFSIPPSGIGLLGVYVAYLMLNNRPRSIDDLSEEEKQIVSESSSLIHVINIETLDRLGRNDITSSLIKDRLVELTNATIEYFFDYSGKSLDSRYQMRLVKVIRELRKISKNL
jgi:hypothetical protein